jgi:hypothetical protein
MKPGQKDKNMPQGFCLFVLSFRVYKLSICFEKLQIREQVFIDSLCQNE